ncbi:MAG: hypothetical protein ACPGU4_11700 [Flavobacteriales bacterium]
MRLLVLSVLIFCQFGFTKAQNSPEHKIDVQANKYLQQTGISVIKGDVYRITAAGEWQDADFPPSNANGFKGFTAPMFFGMLLKPLPSQPYMKLCGKVGSWKFPIGTSTEITIKRDGELLLFANDAKGFYDNNSGVLEVTLLLLN